MFVELTDTKQINVANRAMADRLKKQFAYRKVRTIGWPSGHFSGEVRFSERHGEEVSWWYSGYSDDETTAYNLFGRGNPDDTKLLLIDLQFNFPVDAFNRRQGGVFIRDIADNRILLAHRGIVTRGKSRVPRELLLQEANVTHEQVASDVKPGALDVLLVGSIDDADLGRNIREFAVEIRRAAYLVMDPGTISSGDHGVRSKTTKKRIKSPLDAALTGYYDEFTGKTIIRRSSQVTMNCRHGDIVKELREQRKNKGEQYKSVAMDLVVEKSSQVLLYEVKTGSDTQSIYTGIGQLYFHSAALARRFPDKKIIRHLVIPYAPAAASREKVCKELGIKIVTFEFTKNGVVITSGL